MSMSEGVIEEYGVTLPAWIKPEEIGVVMSTFYPTWHEGRLEDLSDVSKVRGDLGLWFIETAHSAGYRVVVAESGSSNPFLQAIPKGVTVINLEKPGMAPGKKMGIRVASELEGVRYIFRSEPEKHDVVNYIPQLVEPLYENEADIVVGKRGEPQFQESYPDYGYESETATNRGYANILQGAGLLEEGEELDLFSGFIALRNIPDVVNLFMKRYRYVGPRETEAEKASNIEGWSNCQIFPVIEALRSGLRVAQVEVPFRYAPTQRDNEMLLDNIETFMAKRRAQRLGCNLEAEWLIGYFNTPYQKAHLLELIQ